MGFGLFFYCYQHNKRYWPSLGFYLKVKLSALQSAMLHIVLNNIVSVDKFPGWSLHSVNIFIFMREIIQFGQNTLAAAESCCGPRHGLTATRALQSQCTFDVKNEKKKLQIK